jgi:hypothetical protein
MMSNHFRLCKSLEVGLKVPRRCLQDVPIKNVQETIGWKMEVAASLYSLT